MQAWEYLHLWKEPQDATRFHVRWHLLDQDTSQVKSEYSQQGAAFDSKLAQLGQEGWELVEILDDGKYLLKRPVIDETKAESSPMRNIGELKQLRREAAQRDVESLIQPIHTRLDEFEERIFNLETRMDSQ